MDSRILWRAALVQLVAVAVLSLIGAVLAGLPSLLAVLVGLHWLGTILAVGLFALWCSRLPRPDAFRA